MTRVGADEMDQRVTGHLRSAPSSLRKHPGAEVNTDDAAPAARAEPPNSSACPAADVDRIIGLANDRQDAVDQRVGSPKPRKVKFRSEEIVALFRGGKDFPNEFKESRARGLKHPAPVS
jgi:hypothetical protein